MAEVDIFAHPVSNRNLNAAEKAWVIYVAESVRRIDAAFPRRNWVVSVADYFDEGIDSMVYRLVVKWEGNSVMGIGMTLGEALGALLHSMQLDR